MDEPEWPKLLKQEMVDRRLSDRKLAVKAGVGRQTIRSLISGEGRATTGIKNLERVLQALGYRIEIIPIEKVHLSARPQVTWEPPNAE